VPTNLREGSRQINMLSVIIPTRNRAYLLAPALESLTIQSLSVDKFEVLVIDNGSTDKTAQVSQHYGLRLTNLRYFFVPEPGLHVGRHKGMLEAQGDILVFADDDIEAFPSWLASIQESFASPDVAMVGGNNFPMFLDAPPAWLLAMWQTADLAGIKSISALSVIEFPDTQREISPFQIWGCNFAIRKQVLFAANGFHPDGMPKELIRFRGDGETHVSQYVAQSGMKCVFNAGASVHHKVTPERMSFAYFRQRGFNQGVSDSYTALRSAGKSFPAIASLLRRIARRVRLKVSELRRPRDVRYALSQMNQGYAEGYKYHQNAYLSDAVVREWVHQHKYYTEATGP